MSQVTDIQICKLPYQDHPFVHGVRNGKDVWLMNNGLWTEIDGHDDASIPLRDGLEIVEDSNSLEQIVEGLDNPIVKKWARNLFESIRHEPTNSNILLSAAIALGTLEKEIATQSSVVLAQLDQVREAAKARRAKCHYCDNQSDRILVWLRDKNNQPAEIKLPWCGCDLMTALRRIWPTPRPVVEGEDYRTERYDE